jgi:hypothetical protein
VARVDLAIEMMVAVPVEVPHSVPRMVTQVRMVLHQQIPVHRVATVKATVATEQAMMDHPPRQLAVVPVVVVAVIIKVLKILCPEMVVMVRWC